MATVTAVMTPPIHHVTFKTTRLQPMVDWYGLVVGLKPAFRYAGGAWLTNDSANHRLALLAVPGLADDPDKITHTGIHHTGFEFADLGDLLDTYVRLKGERILPHGCLDHGPTISFYYADPDGNSVELQVDNFGDWEKSSDFVRNAPEFAANPIGVSVDPDQLVAARNAGTSPQEIHQRAYAGDFTPDQALDLRLP